MGAVRRQTTERRRAPGRGEGGSSGETEANWPLTKFVACDCQVVGCFSNCKFLQCFGQVVGRGGGREAIGLEPRQKIYRKLIRSASRSGRHAMCSTFIMSGFNLGRRNVVFQMVATPRSRSSQDPNLAHHSLVVDRCACQV